MNFASAASIDHAHVGEDTAVGCDPRGYRKTWCCHCQVLMTITRTKRGQEGKGGEAERAVHNKPYLIQKCLQTLRDTLQVG
jgi:hypothetical protein